MKTRTSPHPYKAAGALFCCSVAALLCMPAAARVAALDRSSAPMHQARSMPMGPDTQEAIEWIRATGNNHGQPFAIIDKKVATLHVFDAAGEPLGSSPVLLGLAVGDDSVPGIGERKMSDIRPAERTTPAGRFVSEPGRNMQGEDIVWISYDVAVSMHRVRANNKADRRLERLATPTPDDNRISYGCVNVPAAFYDALLKPVFGVKPAVIYVLPETRPVASILDMAGDTVSRASLPAAIAP
ncbi:hypothetical protein BH10PSE16_BH10PSE16_13000 [soil metagenome]